MVRDLDTYVLMQHKKDIPIRNGTPILLVSNCIVYKIFVPWICSDISHALFLDYGQIHGKTLRFCAIYRFLLPEDTSQI